MKFVYGNAQVSRAKLTTVNFNDDFLLLGFSIVAIALPFALHSAEFPNQLLVGTIVNALLAGSALYLSFGKSLPVIILPSIAALASGFVFNSFTPFLAFLLPAIWLGNGIYVHAIKGLAVDGKMNYFISVLAASILKSAIIGIGALMLFFFALIPQSLVLPMSLIQFATAVLGGAIAGASLYLKK